MVWNLLLLFAIALLHEDVAILAGGFYSVRQGIPLTLATAFVYAGVVANSFLIYGFGRMARRLPVARRWLIGERVEGARRTLERHCLPAILFCRLTPGLLWVTFLACGWFRLSFGRFALCTSIAAAFYVPPMLWLVVTFGDIVLQHLSEWGWVFLAVVPAGVLAAGVYARCGRSYRAKCAEKKSGPAGPPSKIPGCFIAASGLARTRWRR